MTPLLTQPLPWPTGESLPWARERRWEGVPAVGAVAIQPVPHRVDEETLPLGLERWLPREGIPDLVVRCRGSWLRPSWHGSNGLYGFVGLPAGDHIFTIEDPLGRYLPARLRLTLEDRRSLAASLRDLERPSQPEDWRRLVHRVALRPAPGGPRRPGSTRLWGVVREASDRPIPLALVQLDTRFHNRSATATTWSGADGSYVLDLDGERPDPLLAPPDQVQRQGRLCLPQNPAASRTLPWFERLPVLDGALLQRIRSGTPPAGYSPPRVSGTSFRFRDGPAGHLVDRLPLRIGRDQRWDLVLI
jgi:hypothetical protein